MLLSNVIWSYVSKKNGSKRKKKIKGSVYIPSLGIFMHMNCMKKKKEKHQEKNSQNSIFFSIKVVLPT